MPTISFRLLYGFLILLHARGELLWLAVTAHPTAEWIAQQFTEAFAWRNAPRYVVRDRDRIYGARFIQRVLAMGIRDRPISPRSPWQNGYAERLGSIRRDCLDHVVVFGEPHLRNLLRSYQRYYNEGRTHLSLCKDAPIPRAVHPAAISWLRPFWADCTINMGGFEFPTATEVIPWHSHSEIADEFFVIDGELTVKTRGPDDYRVLAVGERYRLNAGRAHQTSNCGITDCRFLIVQGIGKYDFKDLTSARNASRG